MRRGVLGIVVWSLVALAGVAGVVASAASLRFARRVEREMRALLDEAAARPARPIDRAYLATLPPPVRRWAAKAIGDRDALPRAARVRHGGSFRTTLDGKWLPIAGHQLLVADPPAFVWWGRVKVAPGVWVEARDLSAGGEGNMLVKLESTVTLADARGPRIDESSLHRLLGELAWVPGALLDPRHVSWSPIDDRSARATLRAGGREVSGTFDFGEDDLPWAYRAERWRDLGGGASALTPFVGLSRDYREIGGLLVPHEVVGAWVVDGEMREFARFAIESVELDPR